jgi:hypothetical protein
MTDITHENFEKAFEGKLFDPEQLPGVRAYQEKIFAYDLWVKSQATNNLPVKIDDQN